MRTRHLPPFSSPFSSVTAAISFCNSRQFSCSPRGCGSHVCSEWKLVSENIWCLLTIQLNSMSGVTVLERLRLYSAARLGCYCKFRELMTPAIGYYTVKLAPLQEPANSMGCYLKISTRYEVHVQHSSWNHLLTLLIPSVVWPRSENRCFTSSVVCEQGQVPGSSTTHIKLRTV